ncbi:MAG: hypothetical protein J6R40_06545 [Clostridia bacterium]|nr:hypothetical protein [Clostridia bacterium]
MNKRKLTPICLLHYIKLFCRSALFAAALVCYIIFRTKGEDPLQGFSFVGVVLGVIWVIYALEMACRFFPSKLESMGCQKQFERNYMPTEETEPKLQSPWRTFFVALAWFALNGIFGILYFCGVIDKGILVLISLAYGVCDMICILFFCPFQTWIMKNRCCTVCRIYNWDFAMMFTPYIFVMTPYTWSLLGLSLLLLLRWEIGYKMFPERFSDKTNAYIRCQNCTEKLCRHKKQLKSFIAKNKARFRFK